MTSPWTERCCLPSTSRGRHVLCSIWLTVLDILAEASPNASSKHWRALEHLHGHSFIVHSAGMCLPSCSIRPSPSFGAPGESRKRRCLLDEDVLRTRGVSPTPPQTL